MPREHHIAIIGDGAAALAALAVLRDAGQRDVAVYGDAPHPLGRLERYARSVSQERMRSEGEGHLSPAGFPGLALIDSWRRRTPLPALASLFNLYTPPLDLLLDHAAQVARRAGFEQAHVRARVGQICRPERDGRRFELADEDGAPLGSARHIVLALGHPGLRWPAAAGSWRFHPRVAHAYHEPSFAAGERVVVVGGGIAAAHAWVAALAAGASVTALHRSPPRTQQLNAARCMFGAAGIAAYRSLSYRERAAWLRAQGGSYPWRWRWELALARAARAGRFQRTIGEVEQIDGDAEGRRPLALALAGGQAIEADRLVFATGFRPDPCGHALVRHLVEERGVPLVEGMLCVRDDYTLAPLSAPGSTLTVVGTLARLAIPVADTFFGMKFAARRIAPLLV